MSTNNRYQSSEIRTYIIVIYSFCFGAFITFLVQSGFLLYSPSDPSCNLINYRKQKAASNWEESILQRNEFEKKNKIPGDTGLTEKIGTRVIWDHWYPTFDCPYMSNRFGIIGDGGKWVCGIDEIDENKECIVYSFGVRDDTSFEDALLTKTKNCKIFMFDPTITAKNTSILSLSEKFPSRTNFTVLGLSGSGSTSPIITKTLKSIMSSFGHTYLDILKIDVEGYEVKALVNILDDFPEALPFGQLQIELHIPKFKDHKILFHEWRNKLEAAGLRPFHSESNMNSVDVKLYMEFSFLNIKSNLFKLN